jgi:hypothetical protein
VNFRRRARRLSSNALVVYAAIKGLNAWLGARRAAAPILSAHRGASGENGLGFEFKFVARRRWNPLHELWF